MASLTGRTTLVCMAVFLFEIGHGYYPPVPVYVPCSNGHVVQKGTGNRVACWGSNFSCMKGSRCNTGDDIRSCCLERNPCRYGPPYRVNNDAPACRGPNKVRCPDGFTCHASYIPQLHSVCCPEPQKCPYGIYYKDVGTAPSCNPSKKSCPRGFECNGSPGFCCRKRNQCPRRGIPYRVNGGAPNCFGSNAVSCPKNYSCVGSSFSSSVCCPGDWCASGRPRVRCSHDPCKRRRRCKRYPKADCVVNTCGRCSARFYYKGRDVTKFCRRRIW